MAVGEAEQHTAVAGVAPLRAQAGRGQEHEAAGFRPLAVADGERIVACAVNGRSSHRIGENTPTARHQAVAIAMTTPACTWLGPAQSLAFNWPPLATTADATTTSPTSPTIRACRTVRPGPICLTGHSTSKSSFPWSLSYRTKLK